MPLCLHPNQTGTAGCNHPQTTVMPWERNGVEAGGMGVLKVVWMKK